MSDASIVYVSSGAFLLRPPGKAVFHERGFWLFPTYGGDGPTVEWRRGEEVGRSRCGRLIYRTVSDPDDGDRWDRSSKIVRRMEGIRRDVAGLVCRPCRTCQKLTPR